MSQVVSLHARSFVSALSERARERPGTGEGETETERERERES